MNILNNFEVEKCCGCGACINTCPVKALDYSQDKFGFIVPQINEDLCINCGKCIKVCPYHNSEKKEKTPLITYAAVNKDEKIAINSSSGGIFGAVASYFIKNGGVVYGCELTNDLKAQHSRIDDIGGINRIMRSKYIQSYMGDAFVKVRDDLKSGRKVLFSGTPCQISGLLSYLGELAESKDLFVVDIVCHGVPSQLFFDTYIEYLGVKERHRVESYSFRFKKKYLNGMKWYSHYKLENNKTATFNWPEDSYNYYYMKGVSNRESCYSCPFASLNRESDLTLCDYWHWTNCGVSFKKGSSVSAVIVNSEKGRYIIDSVKGGLLIEETSLDKVVKYNGCINHCVDRPGERDEILNMWLNDGYKSIDTLFRLNHKKNIWKYRIMRYIPDFLLNIR